MDPSPKEKLRQLDHVLDHVDIEDAPFVRELLLEKYREVDAELAEMQQVEMDLKGTEELL